MWHIWYTSKKKRIENDKRWRPRTLWFLSINYHCMISHSVSKYALDLLLNTMARDRQTEEGKKTKKKTIITDHITFFTLFSMCRDVTISMDISSWSLHLRRIPKKITTKSLSQNFEVDTESFSSIQLNHDAWTYQKAWQTDMIKYQNSFVKSIKAARDQ